VLAELSKATKKHTLTKKLQMNKLLMEEAVL